MIEQWIKWEPIKGLSKKYYIDSIVDDLDEFKILLIEVNEKNKVLVTFPKSVDSYESTDETFRLDTIVNLGDIYGKNFYGDWTFFKISNSEYIKRLTQSTSSNSNLCNFIHFSFIESNKILDVIATYEPKVEFII